MKKTLIASAIAAATLASSAAFAADAKMPTLYGNIQLAYGHTSEEASGGTEQTTNDFFDNGSTLGVKHSHEIMPGVEGFLKAEFEFNADNKDTSGGVDTLDEAFIGVKGGFGSVLVGSEDTVYEWVDMIDFTEASSFAGEIAKDEEGDQLQYVSPKIAGGLKVGVSLPLTNDTRYTGQVAGMYSTDMFEVALAYSIGKEQTNTNTNYGDTIGLAGKVNVGDLSVIGQYETRGADENKTTGVENKSSELDLYALAGIYTLGSSQFALGYKATENGADVATETDLIFVQALHNLSDNMYVYVEYGTGSEDVGSNSTDTEELYLGAAYTF